MTNYIRAALIVAAGIIAAIVFTFVPRAHADDFPIPKPTTADHCINAAGVQSDLVKMAHIHGGLVAVVKGPSAQIFSDAWRKRIATASVPVTVVYLWTQVAVVVLEIGKDGCLATVTGMNEVQFKFLLDALPDAPPPSDKNAI